MHSQNLKKKIQDPLGNLAHSIFGQWGTSCSNEGPHPFPREDNNAIKKIHWRNLYDLLPTNRVNFNQSWHKASSGKET